MCRFLGLLCIINRITTVSDLMVLYNDFAIYYFLKYLNLLSLEIFIAHWISRVDIFLFISLFISFFFLFSCVQSINYCSLHYWPATIAISSLLGFCRLTFPFVIANTSSIFPFVALHSILLACILPALKFAGKKAYVLVLL